MTEGVSDITEVATGTIETPSGGGLVTVDGLGFEPDLLLFTATNGAVMHRTDGWCHGKAVRHEDGTITQNTVSVATDAVGTGATVGAVRTGQVFDLVVHDADSANGLAGAIERTTADGFEVAFDASALPKEAAVQTYMIDYQAFKMLDGTEAAIGHTVVPASPGVQEIDLGVDASFLTLTATTATGTVDTPTISERPVGVCHGSAVADGDHQQVQTSTVDPQDVLANGFAASTDRVLHLLEIADGTVSGRTTARVTGLGETLELTYDEIGAGGGGPPQDNGTTDNGAVVAFVALAAGEDTPEIGTVEFPSAEAGGEQTVIVGRTPGVVSFTSCPAPPDGGERALATLRWEATARVLYGLADTR